MNGILDRGRRRLRDTPFEDDSTDSRVAQAIDHRGDGRKLGNYTVGDDEWPRGAQTGQFGRDRLDRTPTEADVRCRRKLPDSIGNGHSSATLT